MAGDSYLQGLLGSREEVLFLTRQHWLALVGGLLVNAILFIAIIAVLVVFNLSPLLLFLAGLSLVLVLVHSGVRLMYWLSNQFVVTNRRIIHTFGAFSKNVSNTDLEDISDTRFQQSVFGRLLGYADFTILTASEKAGSDRFAFLWHPHAFQRALVDAIEALN
jgi:uncharacterized membrane protein YdbT with pleckstrin-like domain